MEFPDFLHGRLDEIVTMESDGADKRRLWAVVLGLTPYRDGDKWCVCTGPNIQEGVCGFGKRPVDAITAFEHAMYATTTTPQGGGER